MLAAYIITIYGGNGLYKQYDYCTQYYCSIYNYALQYLWNIPAAARIAYSADSGNLHAVKDGL